MSKALINSLVPPSCLLCGSKEADGLCDPCKRDLPWLGRHCQQCALPLASEELVNNDEDMIRCGLCLRNPPSFDRCISAFQFSNPIGPLINQFKLSQNLRNGRILGTSLAEVLKDYYQDKDKPQAIVPIPLHWSRILRRGFNQATSISQLVSNELKIPVKGLLKRQISTPKQQGLNRKQRLSNLQNAFTVKLPSVNSNDSDIEIPNHLALVDDVMTTGATAEAASKTLKKAGVKCVDIWVLARTPSPH